MTLAIDSADTGRRQRRGRRVRIDERMALGCALLSGIAAAASGASPTGARLVDATLVALAVGVVTWAGAAARWWALGLAAAAATALAGDVVLIAFGGAAFALAVWVGLAQRSVGFSRVLIAGVSMNVLVRGETDLPLGVGVSCGVVAAALICWSGIRRRSHRTRRVALWVVGAVVAVGVLATIGAAIGAYGAQDGLVDGNRHARAGLDLVRDGAYAEAAERFDDAAASFDDADNSLNAPWAFAGRVVPIVAQHHRAGYELADTAAAAAADVADSLRSFDVDGLRFVGGRVDLANLRAAASALTTVQASFEGLRSTIADVESPWLAAPVQDRLDALAEQLDEVEPGITDAADAVRLAPHLLGADGPRTYFVAFTTPAEARGLGGFMGNYAVLTADDGRVALTDFGRTGDLNRAVDDPRRVTGPDEWLERYGEFGFTSGANGTTEPSPWSNVTISPDFPSTAQVIAELYPQSGGTELDGVFAMDPYVIREFLRLTGPVEVSGTDEVLDERNVIDFLLVDQYEIDQTDDRVDLLEDVSRTVVERVLRGDLPNPVEAAQALSPMVDQRRLVAWSADADEQALFDRTGLSGALPNLQGGDGVALVVNNAGANKLDAYLDRQLAYSAFVDQATGEVSGTLAITLSNEAPSAGLPDGVIGNYTGDAPGTNRLLVSLYTALPAESVSVDGEPILADVGEERGWTTNSFFVAIPPGGSVDVELQLAGRLALADGYTLVTRPQPLVIPEQQRLVAEDVEGRTLIDVEGTATQPTRYVSGDTAAR
ncbi:MAG: DUF4012 domain-containing protein [Actinomycetota bacterium]